MDQSMWPEHLRDDAPTATCDRCGRKTVAVELFGRKCTMPQPNRPSCGGTFSNPRGPEPTGGGDVTWRLYTLDDLDAIKARSDAATRGPWWAWDRGVGWHIAVGYQADVDDSGRPLYLLPEGDRTDISKEADARFIAAARDDVPALLDEVRRQKTRIEDLEHELRLARQHLDVCPTWQAVEEEDQAKRSADV